ncbi:MAG: hypothetical protein DI564_06500 [Rhodanobacter denitrificans]|uniref:Polymer-forming cytoskeletal protein n=1 Tax=Rhodanobacter denitrificans TaxID=666685 RepID=A0A2W5MFK9_9GAMM|nr:MAG: hypothetical protein DI564_06500 [Rhodanobacter denitrificans]
MFRMTAFTIALLLSCSALAADGGDISKVNGSVRVEANKTAGEVSTVNGSIRIEDGARIESAETVNGSITLTVDTVADSLSTVNGSIQVGERSRITESVEAVNGRIHLDRGADVGGAVSNVNGEIRLDGARVGGGIKTVSGNLVIGADSQVSGGVLIEKPSGWFKPDTSRKPRVVIGPRAVVDGTLEFRREVDLYVSDSARIGPVSGATPKTFSGDQPTE